MCRHRVQAGKMQPTGHQNTTKMQTCLRSVDSLHTNLMLLKCPHQKNDMAMAIAPTLQYYLVPTHLT